MEAITEEDFSINQIDKISNYSDAEGNGTFDIDGLFLSYGREIDKMTEEVRKFYETFGNQTNYILAGMYVPVMLIAIFANILVIAIVFKNGYMRSVTNYFVVNLSVADLLVSTVCMPISITQAFTIRWLYGEILCKLFHYLQAVAVAASVFTIMVMSIDRYLAIKNPITFRQIISRKRIRIIIMAIWLVSLSIFTPLLKAVTLERLDENNFTMEIPGTWENSKVTTIDFYKPPKICFCFENLKLLGSHAHFFGIAWFILAYAIPGTVILVMYWMMSRTLNLRKPPLDTDSIRGSVNLQQSFRLVRERKRIARIVLVLAILFALCWLPFNIVRLLTDLCIIQMDSLISDVLSYSLFLGHVNSMLNPVFYCFMSRTFRRNISEILCRSVCCLKKRKYHRNNLAIASWACSSREVPNRTCSNNRTISYGVTHRMSVQFRVNRDQSATTSIACDSFNGQQSPRQSCYNYAKQSTRNNHQVPKFREVPRELRGSLNDVTIVRNVDRTETRSQSLDSTTSVK